MPITLEHTTSLFPEVPLGIHSIAVDGLGSLFVAWKDGLNIRIQRYNRNHSILNSWFTSFTVPATTTPDHIILTPFVSGGCAVVYATTPLLGNEIRFDYIDRNGVHVPGGAFTASFDSAFPQIACATNAKDQLAITFVTITDKVMAQIIEGVPLGIPTLLPMFQVNSALVASQNVASEKSLLSLTSNWAGGNFAALYMKKADGNGLIRKFNQYGIIGSELNVLESFRECPTGGANRGLPCLFMEMYSEKLCLVNPVIPIGTSNPPTRIRARLYNESLTGTLYNKIHNNPLSTNFKLNCLGGALFNSGNATFAIDDDKTNINIFYLDQVGNLLNVTSDLDVTSTFATADCLAPSAFALGNRITVGFHNPTFGPPPGTSFILGLKLTQERHMRSHASRPTDIARTLGVDDDAVANLTNGNTTVVNALPRPSSSLNTFVGTKDLTLVGGPINNLASFQLFTDIGPLGADLNSGLLKYGISDLTFLNLTANGNNFDDRIGSTNNAPQITVTIPSGTFRLARHKIGNTVYDYAVMLRVPANRDLFVFAGIRDVSTRGAAHYALSQDPTLDNPLEIFDAVLMITTYPDSVTTVADYETQMGLGNVTIKFRPIVGIRENSPLD